MARLKFGAFLAPHHPIGEHPMLQFRRGMRTTNLNQILRDAGKAIARNPEVRQAVSQATKQLETKLAQEISRGLERLADRFEAPKAKPAPTPPSAKAASNGDFVKGLYRELLGRPHAASLVAWSLLGRLPLGMTPLALLFLLRGEGYGYGAAGVGVAGYTVAVGVGAPIAGRRVDRLGPGVHGLHPRPVGRPAP